MTKLLTLTIPGNNGSVEIIAPSGIPTGGIGTASKVIQIGITLLLITAIIFALGFIIWGGIQWTTSSGDKQKIADARKTIVFAIVGLLVSFLAAAIVSVVSGILGVNLLGF